MSIINYEGNFAWTELIVFVASVYFAIIDDYSAAYFGMLTAIYLATSRD